MYDHNLLSYGTLNFMNLNYFLGTLNQKGEILVPETPKIHNFQSLITRLIEKI